MITEARISNELRRHRGITKCVTMRGLEMECNCGAPRMTELEHDEHVASVLTAIMRKKDARDD